MTRSIQQSSLDGTSGSEVATILLVNIPPSEIGSPHSDSFSWTQSGRDALSLLRVLRFRWLITNLDVPDMRPWNLFERARRSQPRLQCVLVDDRLTVTDERLIRQAGAAAFASSDPALCEMIDRVWRQDASRTLAVERHHIENPGSFSQEEPARAPP
jgi:DNA-binding NtrC family response regulator